MLELAEVASFWQVLTDLLLSLVFLGDGGVSVCELAQCRRLW